MINCFFLFFTKCTFVFICICYTYFVQKTIHSLNMMIYLVLKSLQFTVLWNYKCTIINIFPLFNTNFKIVHLSFPLVLQLNCLKYHTLVLILFFYTNTLMLLGIIGVIIKPFLHNLYIFKSAYIVIIRPVYVTWFVLMLNNFWW